MREGEGGEGEVEGRERGSGPADALEPLSLSVDDSQREVDD